METFESYRALLFSIAYRMTGSASEADDLVQETYLRYREVPRNEIRFLKSYLCTIITRLCLDYLKSARVQREQYIGPWLPEPVLTVDAEQLSTIDLEKKESISLAFLVLLETLNPQERAIFLLHEVFDYPFAEIAEFLDKTPATCRQIFHRAKKHLAEHQPRFTSSKQKQQQLIQRFLLACQSGNLTSLTNLLAQDAMSWSDGGGKATAATRPLSGREVVARFWMGVTQKALQKGIPFSLQVEEVNGSPAILIWNEQGLWIIITFEEKDEQIQHIRAILNPDKLAYIQRQMEERQRTPFQQKSI